MYYRSNKRVSTLETITECRQKECPEETIRLVTFELNTLLDLSGRAVTKSFSLLMTELLLQVLCKSTQTMAIWVIRGDEGVGDIPGVQGGSGEPAGSVQ